MSFFNYKDTPYAEGMREDIAPAYRKAWDFIANPGVAWTGGERVAIVAESRASLNCRACNELTSAISPYAFKDKHDSPEEFKGALPNVAVDAIHRIVTDQSRFSKKVMDDFLEAGLTAEHYVELLGVVVIALSIDDFTRGLSLPLEYLPAPVTGEPSQYRIPDDRLDRETAFVPMLRVDGTTGKEADLWPKGITSEANNVLRALSAVPQIVREYNKVAGVQYWIYEKRFEMDRIESRTLNRVQIELVASKVASYNECFY